MNEKRILLFEDEQATQSTLKEILTSAGHQVTASADGTAAISHLQHDKPDIVVCDLELSGHDGIEVIRRLRRNNLYTGPVLAISEKTGEKETLAAKNAGADTVLHKPVSTRELLDFVGEVEEDPAKAPAGLKGSHIMVYEDEPSTLHMFQAALQEAGYRVTGIEVGASAMETFEDDPPDLILTDLVAPGIDGMELIKELRQSYEFKGPIIAVSAHAEPKYSEGAVKAGADEFMAKPVGLEKLLRTVRRLLEAASG